MKRGRGAQRLKEYSARSFTPAKGGLLTTDARRLPVPATTSASSANTMNDVKRAVARAEEPYPPAPYAWYVVGVLMVVYVFSFIDRQILSLLVGPIRRDLAISDTQMSLLMGFSFALFYTFFGLPLGRLADSKSRRGLIAAGLFTLEPDDRGLRPGAAVLALPAAAARRRRR